MQEKPLTPAEAAASLGVTAEQIRYLIRTGQIDAFNVAVGKAKARWRIDPSALTEFKRKRGNSKPERKTKPAPASNPKEWV